MIMNEYFKADYERFCNKSYKLLPCIIRVIKNYELRFLYFGRKYELCKNRLIKRIYFYILRHYRKRYGLEITFQYIGKGLRLVHPFAITVNAQAVLGDNVELFKGVTIGEVRDGRIKGNPKIGNNVSVFANALICGNIQIGDNVQIAGGAFVNFDVPDNCIVIGNPGVIHKGKSILQTF